jgi:hypothetical protein
MGLNRARKSGTRLGTDRPLSQVTKIYQAFAADLRDVCAVMDERYKNWLYFVGCVWQVPTCSTLYSHTFPNQNAPLQPRHFHQHPPSVSYVPRI